MQNKRDSKGNPAAPLLFFNLLFFLYRKSGQIQLLFPPLLNKKPKSQIREKIPKFFTEKQIGAQNKCSFLSVFLLKVIAVDARLLYSLS